ncbi:hypothetical protein FRC09_011339 [Ceratobasidium sp. 395]|nr:hypothetical protein FRC09_011339 [Ceratobasidium sp. 395]
MSVDLLSHVLEQLQCDAAQPVDVAIPRFCNIPPPPEALFITLSGSYPTIFTSLDTLGESLDSLLALPAPSPSQLAELRQLTDEATSHHPISTPTSLCITHSNSRTYVPVWTVQVWLRLHTLIRLALSWIEVMSSLVAFSETASNAESLATTLFDRMSTLAFDSATPNSVLRHLRTSHLPTLILNKWLSDEHIDASVELINWHPDRSPGVQAVSSYFIDYMRRQFDRSPRYPASRLTALDKLVMDSVVTELLVPLHLPSHWVLLHVNIGLQSYSFTDTLDLGEVSAPPETIRLLNRWLSGLLGYGVTLAASPRVFGVGPQFDSSSCGVAVMSSMAHYALGGTYRAWTQSTAMQHRMAWAIRFSNPTINLNPSTPETFLEDLDDPNDDAASTSSSHTSICAASTTPSSNVSSIDDSEQPLPPPTLRVPLRQTTLPFQSISRSDWLAQEKRRYVDRAAERQDDLARSERLSAQKKAKRREYERNRKRVRRARQKAARRAAVEATKKLVLDLQCSEVKITPGLLNTRQSVSSHSRPYSSINAAIARQDSNKPSRRQTPLQPTHRINWCQDTYWSLIDSSAKAVGYPWRPVDIVKRLRLIDPDIFQFLRPQRISQWRDHRFPNELRWTESHLHAIKAGSRPVMGAGRRGVFHNRPDVVQMIKNGLLALRKTGASLNLRLIRGYMVGVIQHHIPNAFSQVTRSGRLFRCSERFVRHFLRKELGWSVRKATRAAQKHPSNVRTVLRNAFLRIACAVRDFVIPACCIVNADQTQVVYSPGDKRTWTTAGERQISVLGIEDKRAFTLMVGVSCSGALLPFQAIYAGKSARSVPNSDAPGYAEAQKLGFLFDHSNTSTYWSTFDTMCHWVSEILAPYFRSQIELNNLPDDQQCLCQLDCWTVHRSAQFRAWMRKNYPWIILDYVPGGCTGLFQACDVGIQRVLKLAISNCAHADIVVETVNALRSGVEPQYVVNDQSLPTLRQRSLNWILQAYYAVNKPELIKKAFSLCAVPESPFNLSYESLVSVAARQAIMEVFTSDPALYRELTSGAHPSLPVQLAEDDAEPFADEANEDEDLNPAVDEVCELILGSRTAQEAAQPINSPSEVEGEEDEDIMPVPVPTTSGTVSTRSGRATRLPTRFSDANWVLS